MWRRRKRAITTEHGRYDLKDLSPGAVLAVVCGKETYWITTLIKASLSSDTPALIGAAVHASDGWMAPTAPGVTSVGRDLKVQGRLVVNGATSRDMITKIYTYNPPKVKRDRVHNPRLGHHMLDLGLEQPGSLITLDSASTSRINLIPTQPITVGAEWVRGMFVARIRPGLWQPAVSPYDCSVSRLVGSALSLSLKLGDEEKVQSVVHGVLNVTRNGQSV